MIFTDRTITIKNDKATIDKNVIFYRGDKDVEIRFTIVESPYKYKNPVNVIETANASWGQLVILNSTTSNVIVSDIASTDEGRVVLKITGAMMDEVSEVGDYTFQIRLYDEEKTSRVTMPEVVGGITIKEPLSMYEGDTAEVGVAATGVAKAQEEEYLEPFDKAGNYNETTWATGDIITSGKLNKLEDGITGVNQKVASLSGGTSIDDTTTATNKTWSSSKIDSQIKDIANLISQDGGGLNFDNLTVSNTVSSVVNDTIVKQEYLGGYIEIQPDSWDGEVCAVDSTTKTWGFPMSLLGTERNKIKNNVFPGYKGIMYIRFPLGFAYRGYRNIDETSRLARNIGERFSGQNKSLSSWFENIAKAGGGLAPEYWCPAPHWLTSGSYSGDNQISAGGTYDRTTTLASIKVSDPTQYNAQIAAFTDAIVDDLEYLHQNIAPVRMFGLQNEPQYGKMNYGACKYDAQTYNDILEVLYPKIQASSILSTYNDEENEVKLLVASSDESSPFTGIAKTFIDNHADMIWGYTHHSMRKASGEHSGIDVGADWYKSSEFSSIKGSKTNVFINEYEYFDTSFGTDDFRCSNNMLHLINELIYGEAKVLHPIIHICKPLGQSLRSTNTEGYCMFVSNLKGDYGIDITNSINEYGLNKGTFIPNTWVYNSWSMFGDNLPVGAYLVGEYTNKIANAGWCTYKYNGKLHIFMANNSNNNAKISLTFNENKEFDGRMYSMNYCGTKINDKKGKTIDFVIPAYSGQCWIEKDISTIELIPCTNITLNKSTLTFTDKTPQTLTTTLTPTNTTDTITWSVSPNGICTVNNGVVTPIGNGECTITATCGTKSATCNVTVSGIDTTDTADLSLYEPGYYNDMGKLVQADKNYTTVNYAPCVPGSTVTVSISDSYKVHNFRMAYYKEDKTFMSRTYGKTGVMHAQNFVIPSDVHYVKIGILLLADSTADAEVIQSIFDSLAISIIG